MVRRFFAYGILGWALEVAFTSSANALKGDARLRGQSYFWMLPIYGAGGLLFEAAHRRLASRAVPRWARALAYTAAIYAIEYASASLLDRVAGEVPWRYRRGLHLHGYVRLDYAPFWYACGWLFESVEAEVRKLDLPAAVSAPAAGARAAGSTGDGKAPPPPAPARAVH